MSRRRPGAGAYRIAPWLLVVVAAATGCDPAGDDPPTVDYSENTRKLTVEELGALGARVHLEPERARGLIVEAGLTPREFEARVRTVADEPPLALTYARGFERVLRRHRAEGDAGPAPTDGREGDGGPRDLAGDGDPEEGASAG